MWRQKSLFHARWVTSIITKGAGDISSFQLTSVTQCCWLLAWQPHTDGEEDAHKISLHFIVHRLKAVSKASQSWRIDLFDSECVGKDCFCIITNKAEALPYYALLLPTQIKHCFPLLMHLLRVSLTESMAQSSFFKSQQLQP